MAEIFEGGASQAKNVDAWVNANGESTDAAKALAEQTERKAEAIRNGTEKELLEMYVDLLRFAMPSKADVQFSELTVDEKYKNKGLLAVVEANSAEMELLFNKSGKGTDYRLLSYATVYKNFKAAGMDANYLPMGAKVRVENGVVIVNYTDKEGFHSARSELLPWSTAEAANEKYLRLLEEERAEQEARLQREGRPEVDLGTDLPSERSTEPEPTPPDEPAPPVTPATPERVDERSEYERRLDQKVDDFAARHPSLTEQFPSNSNNERIGYNTMGDGATYVASFETPDGEYVSINVRADNADPEKRKEMLEAALDEELARWDQVLSQQEKREAKESTEAPDTPLEKDWKRVLESVRTMVAADSRLTGVVEVKEGPRNARGADKTIIVRNVQTGEQVFYMVGVREKNNPQTYGPVEGQAEDPARVEDAKSIHITTLVMGNGDGNAEIGARVAKYNRLEDFHISSVEKGAYNTALIMAGIDPIEEPAGTYIFDVIFKDRRKNKERKEDNRRALEQEMPTVRLEGIKPALKAYGFSLDQQVAQLTLRHPKELEQDRTITVGQPDGAKGHSLYSVSIKRTGGGTFDVRAEVEEVDDETLDAFIKKNGGQDAFDAAGVSREEARQYLSYYLLLEEFKENLEVAEAELQTPVTPEAAPQSPKDAAQAAADALSLSTLLSPAQIHAGVERYRGDSASDVYWILSQFQDGDTGSYLSIDRLDIGVVSADGSAHWSVELKTAEGETIKVEAEVGPVDAAQVEAYVKAKAELGQVYSPEELTAYLGYMRIKPALKTELEKARAEAGLNSKYRKWFDAKEAVARRAPDVYNFDDEEPAPSATPPEGALKLKEGDYQKTEVMIIEPGDGYTGLYELNWTDGTSFQGELKDGVPDGVGVLTLGGANETIGPMQFTDGKASFTKPDGTVLKVAWDSNLNIFDLEEHRP